MSSSVAMDKFHAIEREEALGHAEYEVCHTRTPCHVGYKACNVDVICFQSNAQWSPQFQFGLRLHPSCLAPVLGNTQVWTSVDILLVLLWCFCHNLHPLPILSSLSCFVPGPFRTLNFIPQALLRCLHLHYSFSYQQWFYELHQCVWNRFCLCPRGSGIVGSPPSGRGIFGS